MTNERICPICKVNPLKYGKAKQCRQCYLKSDTFMTQLRNQSQRANKRANEVRWGEKQINDWHYSEMSPELAYVIGCYLTDGWINIKRKTIGMDNTCREYVDHFINCLISIGVDAKQDQTKTNHHVAHKGKLPVFRSRAYTQNLVTWLINCCASKSKIPDELLASSNKCKVAFLSACIDGDGCVDTFGSIRVFGSSKYLEQLPVILDSLQIRTGGYKYIKTLPSGKLYCSVSINRTDFLNMNGSCYINSKQDRLLSGNRKGESAKNHAPCPECGAPKSPNAKVCKACFKTDLSQIEHLKSIALKGANARWRKT